MRLRAHLPSLPAYHHPSCPDALSEFAGAAVINTPGWVALTEMDCLPVIDTRSPRLKHWVGSFQGDRERTSPPASGGLPAVPRWKAHHTDLCLFTWWSPWVPVGLCPCPFYEDSSLTGSGSPLLGLPSWLSGQESTCQSGRSKRQRFDPWVGKIPWRRKWQPTPVCLPGKFHGHRNLVCCSPWGRKESDMAECVHTHTHTPP